MYEVVKDYILYVGHYILLVFLFKDWFAKGCFLGLVSFINGSDILSFVTVWVHCNYILNSNKFNVTDVKLSYD